MLKTTETEEILVLILNHIRSTLRWAGSTYAKSKG